jgi:hypothetical protein
MRSWRRLVAIFSRGADGFSGNPQLPTSPGWANQFEVSEGFALRGCATRALSTLTRMRVRSGGGRPRKLVGDARTSLMEREREFSEIIASCGDPERTAASGSGNNYICGSSGHLTHRLSTSSVNVKWAAVWVHRRRGDCASDSALVILCTCFSKCRKRNGNGMGLRRGGGWV